MLIGSRAMAVFLRSTRPDTSLDSWKKPYSISRRSHANVWNGSRTARCLDLSPMRPSAPISLPLDALTSRVGKVVHCRKYSQRE
jgi:hypothetical protein